MIYLIQQRNTEDGTIDPKIRYIDLRMGTKCQLVCVMCSPMIAVVDKRMEQHLSQIENKNLKQSPTVE